MLIKLVIDFTMTVLMLVEMAYPFTGNMVHELVGISLFVLFIVHNILNRRWYQTIFKGKMNARRILNITVNLLLIVTMVVLMISAIPISRTVFAFISINSGLIVRQIHTLAAYWGLILISVHLGMHWGMIIGGVRKMTGITDISPILTIIFRVFVVLIVVYGVQASFHRNVGYKLILYSTFDYWDSDESVIKLFLNYLSIMGIYICGTYYVLKIASKKEKNKAVKE